MGTSYNKDKDKDEGTNPDCEPSTPYLSNIGQVIDNDDETETT